MEMSLLPTNYTTQKQALLFFSQHFPTLSFYYYMAFIVGKAGMVAKKGKYSDARWVNDSYDVIKALEKIGGTIQVEGMDNFVNLESPCVFVANHMSTLETFALPCMIQPHKDVTFIVKSNLVSYPFFGHVMQARNPILLERVNPREDFAKAMKEGVEVLEKGRSLIIFPQGTRKSIFEDHDFNSLGTKIAKKAQVPLIPVALKTNLWGTGKLIKDIGKIDPTQVVHFKFGHPVCIEGNGKEEHSYCVDFIRENLNQWAQSPAEISK